MLFPTVAVKGEDVARIVHPAFCGDAILSGRMGHPEADPSFR